MDMTVVVKVVAAVAGEAGPTRGEVLADRTVDQCAVAIVTVGAIRFMRLGVGTNQGIVMTGATTDAGHAGANNSHQGSVGRRVK